MAESQSGKSPPDAGAGRSAGTARQWISGLLFVALAVVTFIAGEDNRWISVPAAIGATIALIDVLWSTQRRRRNTT